MDISKFTRALAGWFRQPSVELDTLLDDWIAQTLREDMIGHHPSSTWECLRKAITDRKVVKSYGMWVLDQPFRDPPETTPVILTSRQLKQAQRIYDMARGRRGLQSREMIWSSLMPSLGVLFNL